MKEKDLETEKVEKKHRAEKENEEVGAVFDKYISAQIDPSKEDDSEVAPVSSYKPKPYFPHIYLDDQIVPKDFSATPGDTIEISCKCKVKRVSMDDDKDEGKSVDLDIIEIAYKK